MFDSEIERLKSLVEHLRSSYEASQKAAGLCGLVSCARAHEVTKLKTEISILKSELKILEERYELGKRLVKAREIAGLSQAKARKRLGISIADFAAIEAGRTHVTSDELKQFAELYGVSSEWLSENHAKFSVSERTERALARMKASDRQKVLELLVMTGADKN